MNTRTRDDGRVVFKHHLASLAPAQRRPYNTAHLQNLLERFDGPVLLLYGDRGSLSQKDIAFLDARLRRFRSARFRSGHNVHTTQPAATARELLTFLADATRQPISEDQS